MSHPPPPPISLLRQLHPLTFTNVECVFVCEPLVMRADGEGEYKCEGREERTEKLVNLERWRQGGGSRLEVAFSP